jgi:hypothetical protein
MTKERFSFLRFQPEFDQAADGSLRHLKKRKDVLDHEVAGQIKDRADSHQAKRQPHPQWCRFPRLHR